MRTYVTHQFFGFLTDIMDFLFPPWIYARGTIERKVRLHAHQMIRIPYGSKTCVTYTLEVRILQCCMVDVPVSVILFHATTEGGLLSVRYRPRRIGKGYVAEVVLRRDALTSHT